MKSSHTSSYSFLFGTILFLYLFYSLLAADICFIFGLKLSGAILPLSFVLACLSIMPCERRTELLLRLWIPAAALIAALCIANSFIYDSTFDSIGYHYDTVVMMAQGWNPFKEYPWNGSVWAMHYAKAPETLQATVLAFTGNLQTVKSINFVFAIAAACLLWHALETAVPSVSRRWSIAVTAVAMLNPVLIWQLFSAYNDYALWLETIAAVSCFVLICQRPRAAMPYVLLGAVTVISINTKFTHFFYIGLECLLFALWCLATKRALLLRYGTLTIALALVTGIFVAGYSPYVTNTAGYGNPFYPLIGGGADIMTSNTPDMYAGHNRVYNFFESLLSVSDSPWALLNGHISVDGLTRCYSKDMRVNGFGILMAPMLLASLALMILSRPRKTYWLIYASAFALSFCFEQTWWARYIPFLWGAVVISLVAALTSGRKRRLIRILCAVTVAAAVANGAVSLMATTYGRLSYSVYMHYILGTDRSGMPPLKVANLNYALRQQFKEKNVVIEEYETWRELDSTDNLYRLFGLEYFECVAELDRETYPLLYEKDSIPARAGRFHERRFIPAF